jgi:preprotein translocase subunit SecA
MTEQNPSPLAVAQLLSAPGHPLFLDFKPTGRKYWKRGKKVEVRTEPKVGRNQPCPCGSGKKFKNCCK